MQLTDALCCALLMITMTATYIQADGRKHELQGRKDDKRLNRRDATVLIEGIPIEQAFHKPKAIYRRVSKLRYVTPKAKYGPPRPKYGPPKSNRKPGKYRGKTSPKYRPHGNKKRAPKPRYGPPKRPTTKPVYGLPKKKPTISYSTNSYQPEPMGFGEPPSSYDNFRSPKPDYDDFQEGLDDSQKPYDDFQKTTHSGFQKPGFSGYTTGSTDFHKPSSNDFHKPDSSAFYKPAFTDFSKPGFQASSFNDYQKPSFDGFQNQNFDDSPTRQHAEPPVDSYGAPIGPNLHDLTYPAAEASNHFDQSIFSSSLQSWKSYQQDQNIDNKYAFSTKSPSFIKPDKNTFVTPIPEDTDTEEELGLNSYSDIYNYRQMKDKRKKKPSYSMKVYKPWKSSHKFKSEADEEIIVGGQYAEPPARYVPKFQPSAPMFINDDEFAPPGSISDPELVASATNSPYVNYKNSNMAFSPQNLNDAFSIVNK